jgi:CYTH domain-containing protein
MAREGEKAWRTKADRWRALIRDNNIMTGDVISVNYKKTARMKKVSNATGVCTLVYNWRGKLMSLHIRDDTGTTYPILLNQIVDIN